MPLAKLKRFKLEICVGLFIFFFASALRQSYQDEAVTYYPIRVDALQYFSVAYNLYHFGAFSDELKTLDNPPPPGSRIDLSPGYPVLLSFFMTQELNVDDFLEQVLRFQSFLGALTAVMTFFIARMSLKTGWAFLAGLLTAINPHLIASEGYLLTESLFTFLLILSILLCSISWKYQYLYSFFLTGVFIALSFMVRASNQLIVLLIAPLFLIKLYGNGFTNRKVWMKQVLFLFLGVILVSGISEFFSKVTGSDISGKKAKQLYSSTTGFWNAFIYGAYPWIKDDRGEFLRKQDPELNKMQSEKQYALKVLTERFRETPVEYLRWYFGGKVLYLWKWDDDYNDDVYIYPMVKKAFETNSGLRSIHRVSRSIHWPLFFLTLAAPILIFFRWRYQLMEDEEKLFLVPACVFFYYMIIFSILQPLTRYGTPLRPVSYILSVASLYWLFTSMLRWIRQIRSRNEKRLPGRDSSC